MPIDNTSGRTEVMSFIEQFYAEHGVSPSIREIVDGTKYASTSAVWHIIRQLRKEGLLITPENSANARMFVPTWMQKQAKEMAKNHASHGL